MKFHVQKLFASFLFLLALFYVNLGIQSPQVAKADDGMGNYTATTTNAECSDFYNLNGMVIDIKPAMTHALAGAEMSFFGSVTNNNKYPVVNGKLYVKILRDRKVSDNNGPDILDAFVVKNNITLKAGEKMDVNFKWKIPSLAIGGDYKLASYFVSSDKFDLAGLNFTETSVGDLSSFTVKGQQDLGVFFKKDGIKVNNQTYYAVNYTPIVPPAGPVNITFPITNTTKTRQVVKTEFNVYRWDNQSLENKIDTISQMAIIEPGKTVNIPVKVSDDKFSVYYVEASLQYKDSKSILGIRFVRDGKNMPRLSLASVVSYPLVAGQKNKIFSCFYNASSNNLPIDGKMRLEIIDKDDANPVLTYEYDGKITSNMSAVAQEFIPDDTYKDFKVHAILYSGTKIVDEVTIPYTCSELDPTNCGSGIADIISGSWVKWLIYILGIFVLLVLGLFAFKKFGQKKHLSKLFQSSQLSQTSSPSTVKNRMGRMEKIVKNNLEMFVFFLLLIFSFTIYQAVHVSASVDENYPNCGSSSGSGFGMSGRGVIPVSTDSCNPDNGALINSCGATNIASTSFTGTNLGKISKVTFLSWPVSFANPVGSNKIDFVLRRLTDSATDNTYFIITYASTTPGVLLKCKIKFQFTCAKPTFTGITPNTQLTNDNNVHPTISGTNLRTLNTIKIGGVTVKPPFDAMALDGNSSVTFKAPREAAGWKNVSGTSYCIDNNVDSSAIINGYQYVEPGKQPLIPIPVSISINSWKKWKTEQSTSTKVTPLPSYNYTGISINSDPLYYWTYTNTNLDYGVWNQALQQTSANISYNSTITTDDGVVLGNNYTVPTGTKLHFNFDNFIDNSRINWNETGGTSNTHSGKRINYAEYPGSANVCTTSNLYASNVNHTDPITRVSTPNVNVYVPFSINPPNSKLFFSAGALDVLTNPITSYPDWGAPPMVSNDSKSWDCSSSADQVNPDTCTPTSAGVKILSMYYAPTYGYFYYGWKQTNGTCQTNSTPLNVKTSLTVNSDPLPTENGIATCTPSATGCNSTRFLSNTNTFVGCSLDYPFYNRDTNKCYSAFQNFASSSHKDLNATSSVGGLLNNVWRDSYSEYKLKFNESVYQLNINVVQTSTTSSSTKPMNPVISGPQFLQVGQSGVYSMLSASTTKVFAESDSIFGKVFGKIFGSITNLLKKAFAQANPNMVKYYIDWDNNGNYDEVTNSFPYGSSATTSYSWATTGTKTFRVYAQDQQTFATSSWVSFSITVGDQYQTPLDTPVLSGSSCTNNADTHLKLTWAPVASSTEYHIYKNDSPVGVVTSGSTLQWPDDSYVAGDSSYYYIYAYEAFSPITSTITSTTTGNWVQTPNTGKTWRAVTSDSSGTNLAAITDVNDYVYTSGDGGATWTTQGNSSGQHVWTSITTSSTDGSRLAATTQYGYIYTSSNRGATWTQQTSSGQRNWYSITSSADGTKLAATVTGGYIYASGDGGATWTTQSNSSGQRDWTSITSSADGVNLAATTLGGYIYTSSNSGSSWNVRTNSGSRSWSSITSNSSGSKLAAVLKTAVVYVSADYGATWNSSSVSSDNSTSLNTIASDSTGNYLVTSSEGYNYVYTSSDGGSSWTTNSLASDWRGVASDSTGNELLALAYNNGIWTRQPAIITNSTTTTPDPITSSPSNTIIDGLNISSGGTWCKSVDNTNMPIDSGISFYSKPAWAVNDKCAFYGQIDSVLEIHATTTNYTGVVAQSCSIDNKTDVPLTDGTSGSKIFSSLTGVLAGIGKHTLYCDINYNAGVDGNGNPIIGTTKIASPLAKCSRVPVVKEK